MLATFFGGGTRATEMIFECPIDRVAIVKRVLIFAYADQPEGLSLYFLRPAVPAYVYLVNTHMTADEVLDLDTWQVLEPGDQVFLAVPASQIGLWMSGALLAGTDAA